MTELPLEIERKFLIAMPPSSLLEGLPHADMIQTYLLCEVGEEKRVRRIEDTGGVRYVKTIKSPLSRLTRVEREEQISEGEYAALLKEADPSRRSLSKTRYFLSCGDLCFEIDVYPFWRDQAVMEVELPSEDTPVRFPKDLQILREITGDPQYKNSNLAKLK